MGVKKECARKPMVAECPTVSKYQMLVPLAAARVGPEPVRGRARRGAKGSRWLMWRAIGLAAVVLTVAPFAMFQFASFDSKHDPGGRGGRLVANGAARPCDKASDADIAAERARADRFARRRRLQSINDEPRRDAGGGCDNTAFGRRLIADDRGRVCHATNVTDAGCCPDDGQPRLAPCRGCDAATGCCATYEHCVACCVGPDDDRGGAGEPVRSRL